MKGFSLCSSTGLASALNATSQLLSIFAVGTCASENQMRLMLHIKITSAHKTDEIYIQFQIEINIFYKYYIYHFCNASIGKSIK